MPTTRETILSALHARLSALPATALRGEVLPERIPPAGLLIVRDGEPGEAEVTLSPLTYHYPHRAEVEANVPVGSQIRPHLIVTVTDFMLQNPGFGVFSERVNSKAHGPFKHLLSSPFNALLVFRPQNRSNETT